MPTNDFLPFGSAAGANVSTQAEYAALAARANGFTAGTAVSKQLNKAWRQSSVISASLAQFIADQSGNDVLDDGNLATIQTNLGLAIKAAVASGIPYATQTEAEAGTSTTKVMSPLRVYQAIAKVVTQATEAAFGWLKISTQAQVNAGIDDTTAVTPKKLSSWFLTTFAQATEAVSGLAKIASTAQVFAGTDDTSIVTPLKLAGSDPWALQPIGVPIPVFYHLGTFVLPPLNKSYRYISLTANDSYNNGVLTGETVSGSFPLVVATGVISLSGSPLNGKTVNLINTEQRVVRASLVPGQLLQDALQNITGTLGSVSVNGAATGSFSFARVGAGTTFDGANNVGNVTFNASSTARTDIETRAKSIGLPYLMRIK
jgi:hypothetical protein